MGFVGTDMAGTGHVGCCGWGTGKRKEKDKHSPPCVGPCILPFLYMPCPSCDYALWCLYAFIAIVVAMPTFPAYLPPACHAHAHLPACLCCLLPACAIVVFTSPCPCLPPPPTCIYLYYYHLPSFLPAFLSVPAYHIYLLYLLLLHAIFIACPRASCLLPPIPCCHFHLSHTYLMYLPFL